MSITSLLTQLNGLFSRAFWFGSFLPLAIFAVINLVVIANVFPGSVPWEVWLLQSNDKLTNLTLAFLGLLVTSYAVAPMVVLFRSVLDGTLLPNWLHDWFRDERAAEARRMRADRSAAKRRFAACRRLARRAQTDLAAARGRGITTGGHAARPTLTQAQQGIADLEAKLGAGEVLEVEELSQAIGGLAAELETTSATHVASLGTAQELILDLANDSSLDAEHRWLAIIARGRGLSLNRPQATRVGDSRVIVEGYAADMYGADFSYIWPRVQVVLPKESPLNDRIQAAQGQVDFAALMLILATFFPVAWLPVLAIYAPSPWPLLLLGAVLPLILLFLYELLVESQAAFGEVVKVVIDQYRLDLLTKSLHQPLPATLSAERQLWKMLRLAEEPGTNQDLIYRHQPQSGGP